MFRALSARTKLAITAVLLVIVALIAYGIYAQVSKAGKIQVAVSVAPNDATVTMDGKTISTGNIYLEPNKYYTFSASKNGYTTKSTKEYITSTENFVGIELVPSGGTTDWSKQDLTPYLQVEQQGGAAADKKGQALTDKYPIINNLPIQNYIYTIGYIADPSDPSNNSIILTIDAAQGYRNGAIQAIRDLGYDPSKYKIEFDNYKNPFAS
jgi:hypothetical protein